MKKLTHISTVLFDFDGVLADSSKFVRGSFEHSFKKFGIEGDPNKLLPKGVTLREAYGKVASEADVSKFIDAHNEFQSNNMHLIQAFEGAAHVLDHLRASGMNIGVITNRANAPFLMDHCKLAHPTYFIVGSKDVKNGKPHPEGILKAMTYFKSKPESTVMIGDMTVDILAGKAAGIRTVAINTSDSLQELVDSEPDFFIEKISDLLPLFSPA